jgi:hypothetical protein
MTRHKITEDLGFENKQQTAAARDSGFTARPRINLKIMCRYPLALPPQDHFFHRRIGVNVHRICCLTGIGSMQVPRPLSCEIGLPMAEAVADGTK